MNILQEFDTIAAVATPMGMGGVGIIRVSGEKAFEIIEKIFTPKEIKTKTHAEQILEHIKTGK